jgi:transposase
MNRFVQSEERAQDTFLPSRLEDYVTDDNPVRVVDVFVEELDLTKLGFEGMHPQATGRPGYHPSTMLKIYLYGYLNRIQSSRRLERETQRNVELMWLTGRLMPDFKTIANFRKNNGLAIRAACRQFIVLCRQLNLFSQAVIAVDGSKFKAVNNRDRNFTSAKVQRRMEQIEASINRYMSALDIADQEESATDQSRSSKLKEKIAALKKRMEQPKEIEVLVQAAPDTRSR